MTPNETSNRGLTAGEAYVFAARLALFIREARRNEARGWGTGESEGCRFFSVALARLLSLTPRPEAPRVDEDAHAGLASGIDPPRMAQFVAWVRSGVKEGEEPYPRERSWACKRVLAELEEVWATSTR